MSEILLTADLLRRGFSTDELDRLRRSGELERVRRGAYVRSSPQSAAEDRHRRLVEAALAQLRGGGVVSHVSAAVLHGLPVRSEALTRVHVTRTRRGGGRLRAGVEVHTSTLVEDDVVMLGPWPVTSLPRTVVDLGRTLCLADAVVAGDPALGRGLNRVDLLEVLERCRGWPGVGRARRVVDLLDGRSESVGESLSRVRIHEAGLPMPDLQVEVFDDRGRLVGRADFGWRERRLLGEFDGRVKYGRLLKPGQAVEDVVYREKLREDAMRDLGWRMARWTWPDLHPGQVLVERLERALGR